MRRKQNPPKNKPSFAIVVDGETEKWYLEMLKRNERDIRVSIKPEIPNKKSIKDQFQLVSKLSEKEYDKVFWLVDLDVLIKELNETPKGQESTLVEFEKYRKQLTNKFANVVVIVNNPCLEFWFLLHFEQTSKYFRTCSESEFQLKKHLRNYEKTQKFFKKENDDIYLKLKSYLKTALSNSVALKTFDYQSPKKAVCEMGLLFGMDQLMECFG